MPALWNLGLGVLLATSCAGDPLSVPPESLRIIFDTDMGSDCDDAGALAILHVYADRGQAEILGCIYSSGSVPYGAGVIEAINIYYGRPDIPVGAAHADAVGDPVDKMTAEKLAKDTAAFRNRIVHNREAEEMTALNRRLLAGQADRSITYLTVGHTKGLYDLLVSAPDATSPLSGHELECDVEKGCRWVSGERGNPQTFVSQKRGVSSRMADYLNGLLAAKPANQPPTTARSASAAE